MKICQFYIWAVIVEKYVTWPSPPPRTSRQAMHQCGKSVSNTLLEYIFISICLKKKQQRTIASNPFSNILYIFRCFHFKSFLEMFKFKWNFKGNGNAAHKKHFFLNSFLLIYSRLLQWCSPCRSGCCEALLHFNTLCISIINKSFFIYFYFLKKWLIFGDTFTKSFFFFYLHHVTCVRNFLRQVDQSESGI